MVFYRKRKRAAAKRPRAKTTRKPKATMARMVKQIVLKNQETKFATNQYTFSGFNSQINSIGDYIACLPNVSQGTGQAQRVGGAIKPTKMVIRGYYTYRTDALAGSRMLGTRLFCFSDKTVSSYPVALSAGYNYNLLDTGGSPLNYTGTALQYMLPHNNDAFKWYADQKHVIQKPYGLTNTLSPSASADITGMDKSMYKAFTITIPASKMPSILKYDESVSSNVPVNFAPFIALGYSDLLSYPADTVVTQIAMEFVTTLYYKDA